MAFDICKLRSFDLETYVDYYRIVCGSTAEITADGEIKGRLLGNRDEVGQFITESIADSTFVGANIAGFDFPVILSEFSDLVFEVFMAFREGRVLDTLIVQALDAIAGGHLGIDPRTGGSLFNSDGKPVDRYSLFNVVDLVLGRKDAKDEDAWRMSYSILEGTSPNRWAPEAQVYPVVDAVNPLEVALAQLAGWDRGMDPERGPARNFQNLAAQCEAAFCLELGAKWSLRSDAERVRALAAEVEEKHRVAVERFQKFGWVRKDESVDTVALKRAIVTAYGAHGACERCGGSGKVKSVKEEPCRGAKLRGRYVGCGGAGCGTCRGSGRVVKDGSLVTCGARRGGCDGTGLNIETAPMLKRTDTNGVSKDRDVLMESGDDDLYAFGEGEHEKVRTTYVPYLCTGISRPLKYKPNAIVATGRISVEGSPIHQFPRKGGVRECITARPGYVLCMTDYAAGELCTLAQACIWIVGESRMAEIINETKDPGSLHTFLASRMLGISFEEARARVKTDKQVKDFRQAAKCFHPDTEILTRGRGWTRIADLTMDDEVASVVPRNSRERSIVRQRDDQGRFPSATDGKTREWWQENAGSIPLPTMEIVWTKPTRLTTRKAEEGLLHFKNENIDLRVTPDHRMLAYGGTKLLKTVEARDFGTQEGWFNAGMYGGGSVEVDERLLRLAVATQADGNYIINGEIQPKIRFGFSKKRKIDRLTSLLEDAEYMRGVSKNGKHKPTTWFHLSDDLSTKVKGLLDADKTLPWWWLELKSELRAAVLDEVAFWDSSRREKMKCYHFSTVLKKNVEVLQALAVITNCKATRLRTFSENESYLLSVKFRYHTRGGNVSVTKLDYDGDVYCLTVPSGCVLVRDGGIPVITHQCGNFGLPGGMGAATFVATKRRKIEGTTTAPDGTEYAGIRFCILLAGAEKCGVEKVTAWKGNPCVPICLACVKVVEDQLKPAFFETYPEVKKYLYKVGDFVAENGFVYQFAWNPEKKCREVLRIRGGVGYTSGNNSPFQGLLGDIGKRAYCRMTFEGYVGVRYDDLEGGQKLAKRSGRIIVVDGTGREVREATRSTLAGSRFPIFLHDEPIAELIENKAHLAGPRIAEIMVDCGRELAPDVFWKAEPALSRVLSKDAEPRYDESGKLVLWTPKERLAA